MKRVARSLPTKLLVVGFKVPLDDNPNPAILYRHAHDLINGIPFDLTHAVFNSADDALERNNIIDLLMENGEIHIYIEESDGLEKRIEKIFPSPEATRKEVENIIIARLNKLPRASDGELLEAVLHAGWNSTAEDIARIGAEIRKERAKIIPEATPIIHPFIRPPSTDSAGSIGVEEVDKSFQSTMAGKPPRQDYPNHATVGDAGDAGYLGNYSHSGTPEEPVHHKKAVSKSQYQRHKQEESMNGAPESGNGLSLRGFIGQHADFSKGGSDYLESLLKKASKHGIESTVGSVGVEFYKQRKKSRENLSPGANESTTRSQQRRKEVQTETAETSVLRHSNNASLGRGFNGALKFIEKVFQKAAKAYDQLEAKAVVDEKKAAASRNDANEAKANLQALKEKLTNLAQ